jgi:AcrR family transcriptional regulator
MTVRTAQKEATRQLILDAVLELVAGGELAEITVSDVARRSGASVATIYRYFPTKDALFEAAAAEPALRAAGRLPEIGIADPEAYLLELWTSFEQNMALLRHQLSSDAGREMRAARYEASRRWVESTLEHAGIDITSDAGVRLTRLGLLLTSSLAFVDLHDRQGLDPQTAVDDVMWAVAALTAATREEQS